MARHRDWSSLWSPLSASLAIHGLLVILLPAPHRVPRRPGPAPVRVELIPASPVELPGASARATHTPGSGDQIEADAPGQGILGASQPLRWSQPAAVRLAEAPAPGEPRLPPEPPPDTQEHAITEADQRPEPTQRPDAEADPNTAAAMEHTPDPIAELHLQEQAQLQAQLQAQRQVQATQEQARLQAQALAEQALAEQARLQEERARLQEQAQLEEQALAEALERIEAQALEEAQALAEALAEQAQLEAQPAAPGAQAQGALAGEAQPAESDPGTSDPASADAVPAEEAPVEEAPTADAPASDDPATGDAEAAASAGGDAGEASEASSGSSGGDDPEPAPEPAHEPPAPERSRQEQRELRKLARREAAQEPEVEAEEQTGWIPYVHVPEPPTGPLLPDPAAEHIAAFDVAAPTEARPEVTEIVEGARLDGVVSVTEGTPSPVAAQPRQEPREASGEPQRTPDPDEAVVTAAAAAAAVAMVDPGEVRPVGARPDRDQRASAHRTPGLEGGVPMEASIERQAGPTTPAQVSTVPEVQVPDGWSPLAARHPGATPSHDRASSQAGVNTPGPTSHARSAHRSARPGADSTGRWAVPRGAPHAAGGRAPDAHEHATEAALASGQHDPAQLTEPLAPSRSPLASFDEATDVQQIDVSARGTLLGRWMHEVNTLIRARWASSGDDLTDFAFGLTGDVEVEILVSRSGRVSAVQIVQSSGVASLDALARLAIPERLPRPPSGEQPLRFVLKSR